MSDIRVGKVNYNPSDRPQDAPVYKQQQRRRVPIFGGFDAHISLPATGYIPFSADNSNASAAGRH